MVIIIIIIMQRLTRRVSVIRTTTRRRNVRNEARKHDTVIWNSTRSWIFLMLEHVAHHRQATGRTRDGCGGGSGGGRVDGWMQAAAAAAVGRSVNCPASELIIDA